MPGNEVKNWPMYEDLRAKGYDKTTAAKITNAQSAKHKKKKRHVQGHSTTNSHRRGNG